MRSFGLKTEITRSQTQTLSLAHFQFCANLLILFLSNPCLFRLKCFASLSLSIDIVLTPFNYREKSQTSVESDFFILCLYTVLSIKKVFTLSKVNIKYSCCSKKKTPTVFKKKCFTNNLEVISKNIQVFNCR